MNPEPAHDPSSPSIEPFVSDGGPTLVPGTTPGGASSSDSESIRGAELTSAGGAPLSAAPPPPPGTGVRADTRLRISERAQRRSALRGPIVLPLLLFLLTCGSTFFAGGYEEFRPIPLPGHPQSIKFEVTLNWLDGLAYMGMVLAVLMAHEMGHFVQALRYGVPATLPFFIPMPLTPIGTMGAVIAMRAEDADRRELFDIAITGPWAGLLVAVPLAIFGVRAAEAAPPGPGVHFGDPLLIEVLTGWLRPDMPTDWDLVLNPLLRAGWVGLFVTGLNMIPIGQLDGGHVAYALLGRKSTWLGMGVIAAALAYIGWEKQYPWLLMLLLAILTGVRHRQTADDRMQLGLFRTLLGWVSLVIPVLCLTPTPVYVVQ